MTATATVLSPSLRSVQLPELPFEVQKRIIQHALLAPTGAPLPLDATTPYNIEWDQHAGQIGREARTRNAILRAQASREALKLMLVCKGWKIVAEQCLYTSPQLNMDNLFDFNCALAAGERKWSSIHLNPQSTPGRYVQTLDLSSLITSMYTPDSWELETVFSGVVEFVPNVTRLVNSPHLNPQDGNDATIIPIVRNMENIQTKSQGQSTGTDWTSQDLSVFLRSAPQLEVLSASDTSDGRIWDSELLVNTSQNPTTCKLDRLHTLLLHGSGRGPASELLLYSSLPRLTRLAISPDPRWTDSTELFTSTFQAKHGQHLRSLTFLPSNRWPPLLVSADSNTLSLHPELVHLSYLHDNDVLPLVEMLLMAPPDHPLEALTISKRVWAKANFLSDPAQRRPSMRIPGDSACVYQHNDYGVYKSQERMRQIFLKVIAQIGLPPIDAILAILDTNHLRSLRVVTVDGYHWADPALGQQALESGDSGLFRTLAAQLKLAGRELRDGRGKPMPECVEDAAPGPTKQVGPVLSSPVSSRKRSRQWAPSSPEQTKADELDDDGA